MAFLFRYGRCMGGAAAAAAGLTAAHRWTLPRQPMVLCDEVGKKPKIRRTLSQSPSSGRHDNTLLYCAYRDRFGAQKKSKEMTLDDVKLLLADIGVTNPYLSERLFVTMDADGGGTVEFKEMSEFCRKVTTGSIKDKSMVLYTMCDLGGQGAMTKEDMRTMLKEMTLECVKTIPEFALIRNDKEADLYAHLEVHTLAQVVANRIVTDMFQVADTTKSGSVSKKEFQFWVQRGGKVFDEFSDLFPVFDALIKEKK